MIVLLACFPKSGSSYLSDQIAAQPDFERAEFTPWYGRREQEIEADRIRPWIGRNCIAQHHVRASSYTMQLVKDFEITPVVLVRNIGDALASLADHIADEDPETPVGYFDSHIAAIDWDERLVTVAELAAPWYINFYVSWWRAMPNAIIRYEDVVLGSKTDILTTKFGIPLEAKPESEPRRFNKGITGRGAPVMEDVSKLMRHYPDVDFGAIL